MKTINKISIIILVLFASICAAQSSDYSKISFFLFDKAKLIKSNNNNYIVYITRCDSIYSYGYRDCHPFLWTLNKRDQAKDKYFNKDEFVSHGYTGKCSFTNVFIRIIKNDSLVMNVFYKTNFFTDIIQIKQIINFKKGDYFLPDFESPQELNKNFIIPQSDTINSSIIQKELLTQADKYYKVKEYRKAQSIYQFLLKYYKYDEYIFNQDSLCVEKDQKTVIEKKYLSEIKYADAYFDKQKYKQARLKYTYAKKIGASRNNYINEKIKIIDKLDINISVLKYNDIKQEAKFKTLKNAEVLINGNKAIFNKKTNFYSTLDTSNNADLKVSVSHKTYNTQVKVIVRSRTRIPIEHKFILKKKSNFYIPESVDNLKNAISLGGVKSGIALGTPYAYSGLRLNFFDKKILWNFKGVSFSLRNQTQTHIGLQLGLYNQSLFSYNIMDGGRSYRGTVIGSQFGLLNKTNKLYGFQFGLYNIANQGFGLQCGIVNTSKNNGEFIGLKLGAVNYRGTNKGLLLGLYNQSGNLGLQIGLVNKTDLSIGVEIGIFNYMKHDNNGYRLKDKKKQTGWAIGLLNINKKTYGVQIGAVNIKTGRHYNTSWSSDAFSLQLGIINKTETIGKTKLTIEKPEGKYIYTEELKILTGFQFGAINRAQRNNGIQIGVLNSTDNGLGIQFGILNFRKNNKWFAKVLPIVNFKIEKKEVKE